MENATVKAIASASAANKLTKPKIANLKKLHKFINESKDRQISK